MLIRVFCWTENFAGALWKLIIYRDCDTINDNYWLNLSLLKWYCEPEWIYINTIPIFDTNQSCATRTPRPRLKMDDVIQLELRNSCRTLVIFVLMGNKSTLILNHFGKEIKRCIQGLW